MVETFFKRACAIHGLRQGPLVGHIDLLDDHLAARGFSCVHSRIQLWLVGHFNRWLEQKGISAEQLDENVIARYCRWLRRRKLSSLTSSVAFGFMWRHSSDMPDKTSGVLGGAT